MAYIGKRPVDTFPANNAVTSSIISENAVGSSEIATNAVTTLQIADNAITSAKIVNGTIVSGDIAANTIATSNIADNAIDSTKIAQNSILTKHIDDAQVTTDQLGADAVTAAKLADDAVVTANIVDSNVTTAKIADDAVTLAKMAGLSRGSILVGDSSGNPSALALGSNGLVLKSDGSDLVFAADSGLSTEEVQDIVGGMFSGNTETNITATYQDSDGTIDLAVAESTSTEDVQDIVGAQLVTNGSHTNLTAAYDDAGDGAVDLTVQQQLNNTSAPYYHKITVTVVSDGGNKYALDGGTQAIAKLTPSVVYRFDQSHSSNSSHPLRIGTAANGSEVSSGYTIYNKVGTPGNAGAYTEIALEQDAPTLLYYWCSAHSGMGAQIAVADESALTQTLTNKTLTSPNITGLSLGGVAVTSTAAELNILDGVTSTTAELNILDGVTSTAAELNILDGVTSTAAELNILDGVTSTAAELNILDGVTSTAAELNILDGVTTTATELNIMDGDTAAVSTTLANADRVVVNDNGTMKQVALSDLATYMGDNVTINQTQTALTVSGNTTIGGNLTVNGTTTTLNTTNSVISDRLIELGNGTTGSPANDMGIVMERGSSANAFMGFDESADKFIVGTGTFTGASTGDLTITTGTLVANLEGAVTGNASTATALANARTIHGVSFDGTANIDLSEVVQDTVGAMFSSNTETGITATYQDSDGTIDLVVGTLNQDTTGNAATATALETARTIHGVSFDGSANIDLSEVVQDTVGAMFSSNTETGITATYEDSDGTIDLVVGTLNQDTTGSAATLTTARTIGGVSFDGSANINLPGVNTAGNQNTTGSAATLTNGRTIGMTGDVVWTSASFDGSGNVTGSATIQADAVEQSMIADDAVGADQLAANSVVSASIVNGSIVSADIAANTIATSNIADNAVDATKLASNSVLTRHIDDNQVTGDQISDDVVLSGTGAVTLPKGTTAQRPSGTAGEFRFNTTTSKFEGHDGSSFGEIGGGGSNGFLTDIFDGTTTPATDGSRVAFTISQSVTDEKFLMVFIDGVYQAHDAYSVSGTTLTMADAPVAGRVLTVHSVSATVSGDGLNVDNFSGDGSDTTFTLSIDPTHENNTQVYIDGVYQFKNTYAVSGTTLTFSSAPPNGSSIEVMIHSQTNVNQAATIAPGAISSLTQVTAVAADHLLLFDATDSALKKCLFSDALETATSISTSADAVALTFDSSENATFAGNIVKGNLTISGTEIDLSSGDLTLDVAGDIVLDAGGQNIYFDDDGTRVFSLSQVSSDVYLGAEIADKDLIFRGNDSDGGGAFTALTLDMSNAGAAKFNGSIIIEKNSRVLEIADAAIQWYSAETSDYKSALFRADDYSFKNAGNTVVATIESTGQIKAASLGVSTPTFAFTNDTDTGMTRPTGDTLQLVTGGAVRLRVSSNGLMFNSDTAAANALDDYEEGTWTPVDSSGASLTFAASGGRYQKVGNTVHFVFRVKYPSTTNSANGRIGGLPYTSIGSSAGSLDIAGGATIALAQNFNAGYSAYVEQNAQTMYLFKTTQDQATIATNATLSGQNIYMFGHYTV